MRRALGVVCACVLFSCYIILCMYHGDLRVVFNFHTNLSCILIVKSAENKGRKGKSTLLQGAGLYIAKNITRLEINARKVKKAVKALINYYILGNNYINIIKRN